jgi:hypothetical protein
MIGGNDLLTGCYAWASRPMLFAIRNQSRGPCHYYCPFLKRVATCVLAAWYFAVNSDSEPHL